jgi:hypothetical protein
LSGDEENPHSMKFSFIKTFSLYYCIADFKENKLTIILQNDYMGSGVLSV